MATLYTLPAKLDSPHITAHFRKGREPLLLLTFNSLSWDKGPATFWGEHVAQRCGYSALGIMANGPNWFPEDDMSMIASAFAQQTDRPELVVAYGHSMGGYGALKYARRFGAKCVIAFGPQFSINPSDLGSDDARYRAHFRPALHQHMRIDPGDAVPNSYVFYDPFYTQDAHNSRLIAEATGCTLIPVFFTGHDCLQPFAGTAIFRELVEGCLAGDVPRLRALANRLRRAHWARKHHLAIRLISRHPQWALKLYRTYWTEMSAERLVDFAKELSANGFTEEALEWSGKVFDEQTGDKGRLNSHVTLLIKAKRYDEAKRLAFIGLQLDPESFVFTRRLSEACAGLNDLDEAVRWAHASIERKRDDASGHNHLAGLLFRAGKIDAAEASCRKALAIDPNNEAFEARLTSIVRRPKAGRAGTVTLGISSLDNPDGGERPRYGAGRPGCGPPRTDAAEA